MATNEHFNSIVIDETVINLGSYTLHKGQPLQQAVTYFWRVRFADAVGNWSAWSPIRSVVIP